MDRLLQLSYDCVVNFPLQYINVGRFLSYVILIGIFYEDFKNNWLSISWIWIFLNCIWVYRPDEVVVRISFNNKYYCNSYQSYPSLLSHVSILKNLMKWNKKGIIFNISYFYLAICLRIYFNIFRHQNFGNYLKPHNCSGIYCRLILGSAKWWQPKTCVGHIK